MPLTPAAATRVAAPTRLAPLGGTLLLLAQPLIPAAARPHRRATPLTPAAGNERHLAHLLTPPATTRIAAPTRLGRHCNADLLPSAQSRIPFDGLQLCLRRYQRLLQRLVLPHRLGLRRLEGLYFCLRSR